MTSAGETAPASTAGQVMTQTGAEKEPSSQASAQKQPSGSPAASPHRHAIALPSASIVRPESFGAAGRFNSPRRGRLWASPTALRQASPSTQWDNRAPGTPHLSPHRRRAAGRERGCCTSTPIGPGARTTAINEPEWLADQKLPQPTQRLRPSSRGCGWGFLQQGRSLARCRTARRPDPAGAGRSERTRQARTP